MKANPNFDTNAPPFEVRGCKVIFRGCIFRIRGCNSLYYVLISIPIVNFVLFLCS